jgi:hypothetical protein
MHEEINSFLQGDYSHALACDLYDKYGDNRRLMRLFRENDTQHTQDSIIHELKVLVRPARKAKDPVKEINSLPPVAVTISFDDLPKQTPIQVEGKDPELAAIEAERSAAYVNRAKLSNSLLDEPSQDKRAEIVKQINQLSADYMEAKRKQRSYESGETIEDQKPIEMFDHKRTPKKVDVNQPKEVLLQLRMSNRAMRSKYRNLVAKLHPGKDRDLAQTRLDIYEHNCRALDAALKA